MGGDRLRKRGSNTGLQGLYPIVLLAWRWPSLARSRALLLQVLRPVQVHVEGPELDQELVQLHLDTPSVLLLLGRLPLQKLTHGS